MTTSSRASTAEDRSRSPPIPRIPSRGRSRSEPRRRRRRAHTSASMDCSRPPSLRHPRSNLVEPLDLPGGLDSSIDVKHHLAAPLNVGDGFAEGAEPIGRCDRYSNHARSDERRRLAQCARYFQLDIRMVEEETLDDDTLRDQVERGDRDWLAAHQSIYDERPGFAENAGYGCAGLACDPVNAERHASVADRCSNFVERPTLIH